MTALQRWWVYQRERFPLVAHSPLVAAMSFGALGYSAAAHGTSLSLASFLFCWFGLLGFFFLLRVADEFKDYATDCQHRPYRAVPRGLISLRELGVAAAIVVATQALMAIVFDWRVLMALAVAWGWLLLMSWEFFVPRWLEARPLIYLISHMLIMPLLMLYALSHNHSGWYGWEVAAWLASIALGVGLIFELGRKLRRPADEQPGVDTYSKLWGRPLASVSWLAALSVTVVLMALATHTLYPNVWVWLVGFVLIALACLNCGTYFYRPEGAAAQWFERLSALVTLIVYLVLGALPWLIQ